jgi:hypothetical protein
MHANIFTRRLLTTGVAVLCLALPAFADSHYDLLKALTDQYTVSASSTQLSPSSYRFVYDIHNNNQGSGPPVGLDAFELLVPISATIENVSNPLSYSGNPGYWSFSERDSTTPGFKKLYWDGAYEQSIYPVGATAHFSFEAHGVTVGSITERLTTYKSGTATDWYYAPFSGTTIGPTITVVPEPSTFVLIGTGLIGAVSVVLRKRKQGE